MLKNRALNPTVIRLGLVSFFADVSSEMLYPITPIFLTTVLGASMTSVGLIEGVAEAIASLLKTYSGFWSDKTSKRKIFVVAGYFLAAIAKPLTGLSHAWSGVLLARGLDRTGKGLRSAPRDAILVESVPPELRGSALGWHRGMDTLGAAVGPLLAFTYLLYFKDHLRPIYYWALIPGLASVVIAMSLKPDPQIAKRALGNKFEFKVSELSPEFKKFLLAWGLFSLTNSSDVFLLMKAQRHGVELKSVILLYCFYNLIYAALSPAFGGLSDRVGRKKLLIFGLLTFSGVYALFATCTELWQFALLFGVYGTYMAATDGVGKALAVDLIQSDKKATGIGVLGTVTGLATVVASTAAGIIWDHAGEQWTFYYGAMGALLAVFILARSPIIPKEPTVTEPVFTN